MAYFSLIFGASRCRSCKNAYLFSCFAVRGVDPPSPLLGHVQGKVGVLLCLPSSLIGCCNVEWRMLGGAILFVGCWFFCTFCATLQYKVQSHPIELLVFIPDPNLILDVLLSTTMNQKKTFLLIICVVDIIYSILFGHTVKMTLGSVTRTNEREPKGLCKQGFPSLRL